MIVSKIGIFMNIVKIHRKVIAIQMDFYLI